MPLRCAFAMVLIASALGLATTALGVDCESCPCTTCSADPSFVQENLRQMELLAVAQALGSDAMRQEGLSAVLVVTELAPGATRGLSQFSGHSTVILIGASGSTQRLPMTDKVAAIVLPYLDSIEARRGRTPPGTP